MVSATTKPRVIDLEDVPELARVVDEVSKTNTPIVLRRNGTDVAWITPTERTADYAPGRVKTQEDYEAFVRAAGSWKGLIDADKFIEEIYEQRKISPRPPVKL